MTIPLEQVRRWPDTLTRKEVSDYLREIHGIRRAVTTLTKLSWRGGGPKFVRVGAAGVMYPRVEVDAWAKAMLSQPVDKASDLKMVEA